MLRNSARYEEKRKAWENPIKLAQGTEGLRGCPVAGRIRLEALTQPLEERQEVDVGTDWIEEWVAFNRRETREAGVGRRLEPSHRGRRVAELRPCTGQAVGDMVIQIRT